MIAKLTLGTAQFGLDYGINNKRGKIPKEEVFEILEEASRQGIDTLDTAYAYGDSEEIIGEYMANRGIKFQIISKLSAQSKEEAQEITLASLSRLKQKKIFGYLLHDFKKYRECPEIFEAIEGLKKNGIIGKIGFSLNLAQELDFILRSGLEIDIIQLPYNIFDQRFQRYFKALKETGIEIHVRSIFLQGLVFKNPDNIDPYFLRFRNKLSRLNSISKKENISIAAICLNFALLNEYIDKIIFGVDNIRNFYEIIHLSEELSKVKDIYEMLSLLKENDEAIILPFNWAMKKQECVK